MLRNRAAAAATFGLAGVLAGGFAIGTLPKTVSPDAILAANYGNALAHARTDTSWTSLPQNIWLSRLGGADANTDRLLTSGDTITIDGKDGRPEVIEVSSREVIDGERMGMPGMRFQLVTGQSTRQANRTVRFMFATEVPAPLPTAPDKSTANRVL